MLTSNSRRLRTPSFWVEYARSYILVEPSEITKIVLSDRSLGPKTRSTELVIGDVKIPLFKSNLSYDDLLSLFYLKGKTPDNINFKSPDTEMLWTEILETILLPISKTREVKKEPEKKLEVPESIIKISSGTEGASETQDRYARLQKYYNYL